MPTLYIIVNDMSSLGRFFSRLRFELSFISIHLIYMSASFTLRASNLATFSLDQLSSRAKRGDLMSIRTGMGLPLSLRSSQRRLQQPQLVNNPG
jgi:hypothetical protein